MTLYALRLVLAGAVSSTLFAAEQVVAAEMMSEAELLSTIPGASLTGVSNEDLETQWVQSYGAGDHFGSASGVFGTKPYSSEWRVGQGLWCETWDSGSGCWRIERLDRSILQPWHGDRKLPNVWTIVTPSPSDRFTD